MLCFFIRNKILKKKVFLSTQIYQVLRFYLSGLGDEFTQQSWKHKLIKRGAEMSLTAEVKPGPPSNFCVVNVRNMLVAERCLLFRLISI